MPTPSFPAYPAPNGPRTDPKTGPFEPFPLNGPGLLDRNRHPDLAAVPSAPRGAQKPEAWLRFSPSWFQF